MREKRGDYHGGEARSRGGRAAAALARGAGASSASAPAPMPRARAALVLILALAGAIALRLLPLVTDPGGELVADSAFHLRMIEAVLAHGRVPPRDSLCEAPQGRAIANVLPTGLYRGAASLHRALSPLDRRDARFHALLFTALAGGLIVVPVFFAARALFPGWSAAAVAAFLAAIVPAHVHRTHALWLRYDALGTLLATTHVALMLDALGAQPRPRAWRSAALAALALLAAVACWRVALVLPLLEMAFAILWAVTRGATREVRDACSIVVGLSTLLFPLVPYLRAQAFPLSSAWLAAVAATAALWLPPLQPARARGPARAALICVALLAGWSLALLFPRTSPYAAAAALVPAKLARAFGATTAVSPIVALELGIEELTSLSPLGLFGPGALSWLAPWFLAAPLLFAWGGTGSARRRLAASSPAPALFAVLCVAMTLLTLLFERNKVLLAPLVAVACGGLAPRLFGSARSMRPLRAALALLFVVCAALATFHAGALALSRRTALAPGLGGALEFLRARTPAGSVVMGPWEHGYEVQAYAERATVTDGLIESAENQRRIVAFADDAMMATPDSLIALCRRHRAGWLLVPPSTHLYALAVVAQAPFLAKLLPGVPLTPAEADRVVVQMMVLGREYPGLEKVFDQDGYRVYRVGFP